MDIGSVNSGVSSVSNLSNTSKAVETKAAEDTKKAEDTAVVYDKGNLEATKTYTPNTELVNQLKADQAERASQLQNLVSEMLNKQGKAYANANAFTSDFWKQFSEDGMSIDEAAVKQAQEDISEDGYWGVKQTSERMLDFAKALTGGDPSKIDAMEEAFEKGYAEATKAWGDELPELSKNTYDAVKQGFNAWREELATNAEAAIATGNQVAVTTA
ncbi:MAG: hypothetical protein K5656_04340 [Lachnospiraceae bacterium]|nr:hypothetical protein [Lachnospiraceae bacterium]